jgi:prepilin-type N-terminal cleavage/methylation domain-containing protein
MWIKKSQNKKNNLQNQSGLSLIELLVAVSIFSLLTILIAGIYLAFTTSQIRTKVAQRLLNNAQFALEGMAREIRNNEIYYRDYPCNQIDLGGGYLAEKCIYLKHEDGAIAGFAANIAGSRLFYTVRDPVDHTWATTGFVFFNPLENIILDDINFLISPAATDDPFVEGGPNQHPMVTIQLQVSTRADKVAEQITYNLQTTVSSRFYKR